MTCLDGCKLEQARLENLVRELAMELADSKALVQSLTQKLPKAVRKGGRARPLKVINVDVDGTLLLDGRPNWALVRWIKARRVERFEVNLWSAQGELHAKEVSALWGLTDIFDNIISKPGFVVDDQGWQWTRFTRTVGLEQINNEDLGKKETIAQSRIKRGV